MTFVICAKFYYRITKHGTQFDYRAQKANSQHIRALQINLSNSIIHSSLQYKRHEFPLFIRAMHIKNNKEISLDKTGETREFSQETNALEFSETWKIRHACSSREKHGALLQNFHFNRHNE